MLRLSCLCLVVATVGVTGCGGSTPKPADAASDGAAGGTGGGQTGGSGTGGSAGSTGGRGGSGGTGGTAGRDGGSDLAGPADVPPPSDAVYDTAPVPPSLPLESAPSVFADVACEKVFACCTDMERMRNPLLGSQAGCSIGFAALLSALMTQATAAIAAGRAMYDPMALADCLMRYKTQSCEQARTSGGVTAYRMCNFIKPLVALGGACTQHIECVNGYCMLSGQSGTCAAKLPNGQMCSFPDQCQGGACQVTGPAAVCATSAPDGLCSAL